MNGQSQSHKPIVIRANPNDTTVPSFVPNVPIRSYFMSTEPMPALVDKHNAPDNTDLIPTPITHNYHRTSTIAISCRNKHCKSTQSVHNHNQHYVTPHFTSTHNATPQHCPMCPATLDYIKSRPLDASDRLCLLFPKLPRKLAVYCIKEFDNMVLANKTKVRSKTTPNIMIVEELVAFMFPKLVTSHGITPLHTQCNDCRATFVVLRTDPTTHNLPTHCIWCASTNITITLPSTTETADLVLNLDLLEQISIQNLANDYSIPLVLMQALYTQWSQQAQITTIKEWMQTQGIQDILAKVHKAQTTSTVSS